MGPLGAGVASGLYTPSTSDVTVHVTPTAEIAIDAAALGVGARLAAGALRATDGGTLPAATQALLRGVLVEGEPDAAARLEAALAPAGGGGAARALCGALTALLTDRAPGQVTEAIRRYNELVRRAEPAFLLAHPPELLGVRAVLAELAAAAARAP